MKYTYILSAITIASLFSACQKEEIGVYEMSENKVYFQQVTYTGSDGVEGYSTFTQFSFINRDPETWKYVVFKGRVQLLGSLADYDRQVKVTVDTVKTTMIDGESYEIDLDTLKIKANQNFGEIGVKFLRARRLRERTVPDTLVLKLETNENFTVLDKYHASNVWSNTNEKNLDGARFFFIIDEAYKRPDSWSHAQNFFGDWNPTRYAYINSFFGFTEDDWQYWGGGKLSGPRMSFYALELKKELQRRANDPERGPVYDDDGETYMQLPAPYEVDYSNVAKPKN